MTKKEKWHFEHDEFYCEKCSNEEGVHRLNFYLGVYKGEDAQKYECSNKDCDFVEIKTLNELYEENEK